MHALVGGAVEPSDVVDLTRHPLLALARDAHERGEALALAGGAVAVALVAALGVDLVAVEAHAAAALGGDLVAVLRVVVDRRVLPRGAPPQGAVGPEILGLLVLHLAQANGPRRVAHALVARGRVPGLVVQVVVHGPLLVRALAARRERRRLVHVLRVLHRQAAPVPAALQVVGRRTWANFARGAAVAVLAVAGAGGAVADARVGAFRFAVRGVFRGRKTGPSDSRFARLSAAVCGTGLKARQRRVRRRAPPFPALAALPCACCHRLVAW